MKRFLMIFVAVAACADPPGIDELTILKTTVDENERIPVSVVTTGPSVEIAWSATGGTFDDATAAETTWIAPLVSDTSHEPATAAHVVTVTLKNEDGSDEDTLEVTVNNLNENPKIVTATASDDSPLPGDVVTLSVVASDGDDTDLTYEWRQLLPADKLTITGPTTTEASVQMPVTSIAVGYEFSVTVKDPSDAEIVRAVNTVAVVPTFAADVLPIFGENGANCGACHADSNNAAFAVLAFDPDDSEAVADTYATLVNNTPGSTVCGDELSYIEPLLPQMSALFLKISGDTCSGSRMPMSAPGYFTTNPDQLATIESWILAGANND